METLNNPKPIQEIVKLLPNIKDKIDKTTNEMKNYLDSLKNEKFEEMENEKEEDAIKRAESILDRLDEIVERRILVSNNGKETIELIDIVKLKIEEVVKSCEDGGILFDKANDELIDKIIDLEERKRIRDVTPLQQQIDNINNKSNTRIQKLKGDLKNPEEYNRKKEEEARKKREEKKEKEKLKRMNTIIDINEMKQIEEWSGMKIGNIIFDSDIDNWNVNTSVFDQKVLNKSNLIFIIEDDEGNKFGSYINANIYNVGQRWINDSKSFVFSLKSNGRLNGMLKFDNKQEKSQSAFLLYKQSNYYLFLIGGNDICIWKENNKNSSYCKQTSYNYNGIQNALCGNYNFTPARITAIQLI